MHDGFVIDQLKPLYRRCRDLWLHSRPPSRTEDGFLFIGSQRRFRQSPDERGTAAILRHLAPRLNRFINVGANAGYFCLLAEQLGLEVIAFEPEPAAFRLLQRNLALNDCRAVAIPAALGHAWQRQSFFGTGTAGSLLRGLSGTPSWDRQRVTVVPFDQLGTPSRPPHLTMLWLLDCEGAEPLVLQGAQATLATAMPLLILEWRPERQASLWHEGLQLLLACGYSHLLSCSSFLTGNPLHETLCEARLADPRFHDNVLVYSRAAHAELMKSLDPDPSAA